LRIEGQPFTDVKVGPQMVLLRDRRTGMNTTKLRIQILAVVVIAALIGGFVIYQSGVVTAWFGGKEKTKDEAKFAKPKLVELADDVYGLELSGDVIESLQLKPIAAKQAKDKVALPPMIGAVNYDPRGMFSIKPLFSGKITWIMPVEIQEEAIKDGSPYLKVCQRPIKFGDKVKQGDVLAVFWSQAMGEKKAALVDAVCSLTLSEDAFDRQKRLLKDGATSEAAYKAAERQVQLDQNTILTVERTLQGWGLKAEELERIKKEAKAIIDQKAPRDIFKEIEKWARVEIKVPEFDPGNTDRRLTILEQNFNLGEMVDPGNTPLFRLADLSRVELWVHPPEEFLKQIETGVRGLKWTIRFQADAMNPLRDLAVDRLAPSLEPSQRTPMLVGYLDNSKYKYLIGQSVTATIMAPPPADTVEIPTNAINPLNGQEFVFVENPDAKNQFLIRRIAVVRSIGNVAYVSSRLTPAIEQINLDVKEGEYTIRPLQADEKVVTRGVVELTAALEEARSAKPSSK
jgi:membrane fusion protein, heavy metal efflux system